MDNNYNIRREELVVTKLTDIWRQIYVPKLVPNACVLSSRVASEVLTYFGIQHDVVPVCAYAINEKMHEHWRNKTPISMWEDDAYSVGISPDAVLTNNGIDRREPHGFEGHLIVITNNHLLDLSALQFHRPQHNIFVDGPILATKTAVETVSFGEHELVRIILEQGLLFYENLRTNKYLKSNDWRKNYRPITSNIIKKMRPEIDLLPRTIPAGLGQ